jgi:hypothetical protein
MEFRRHEFMTAWGEVFVNIDVPQESGTVNDSGRVRLLPNRLVWRVRVDQAVRQESHPPIDSNQQKILDPLRIVTQKSFTA